MKKTLFTIATLLIAASLVMVSCQKPADGNKGGNALIDDDPEDKPSDDKPGDDNPPVDNTPVSLKGSNYYLIVMESVTAEAIADKVVADYRPDDNGKNLWVWDATYEGGEPSGLSFYGTTEGWICLKVTSVGWSGAGWNVNNKDGQAPDWAKMKDIAAEPDKYYLHLAYKGAKNEAHIIGFGYGTEYKFAIGEGVLGDAGVDYTAIPPINNDGKFDSKEWNEYEIKLSDMGIDFSADVTDANVLFVLSGGTTGKEVNLDAVFVYKK